MINKNEYKEFEFKIDVNKILTYQTHLRIFKNMLRKDKVLQEYEKEIYFGLHENKNFEKIKELRKLFDKEENNDDLCFKIEMDYIFHIPKSYSKKKKEKIKYNNNYNKKPDLDNINKSIMDTFFKEFGYLDDKIVNELILRKKYNIDDTVQNDIIKIKIQKNNLPF